MSERTFTYSNETFSGCDMTAQVIVKTTLSNGSEKVYQKIIGELQTVSYSINTEKRPVRSIGNINAKDYVIGPRTIAGSLVFSVFNKHFSKELLEGLNSDYIGTSYLVDELPPFDIVISAANEYGYRSKLVIYGIRLLNEGQVMSINDVYTENTYQYVATDVQYLTDEMAYVRSDSEKKYKLNDNIAYYENIDNVFNDDSLEEDRLKRLENYWNSKMNEAISLNCSVFQPTRKNGKGIVSVFFTPAQYIGNLYISSNDGDNKTILIDNSNSTKKNNLTSYIDVSLNPGNYLIYFENYNGVLSESKKVKIIEYTEQKYKESIIPEIEELTPHTVCIYVDDDSHSKVRLYYGDGYSEYDIKDNYVNIKHLDENTLYSLRSYSKDLQSSSVSISFTTPKDDVLYDNLITYLKANQEVLKIDKILDYVSLIKKYKDTSITPMNAIKKAYSEYKIKISNLNPNDSNYEEKRDILEYNKSICADILTICSKLDNDYLEALNTNNNIPIPKLTLDKNLNYIFQFSKYVDKVEFYRENNSLQQLALEIDNASFKTINKKDYCFNFSGKPGVMHSVYAYIGSKRSVKLQFYVMTNEEKKKYLNNSNSSLDNDYMDKINGSINNDYADVENFKERAFMYTSKKINNPLIINPSIININKEEVIIKTNIFNFINSKYEIPFYIAIASYDDIISNKDIYKIPFRNIDDYVAISYIYHGIKENTSYAVWIEDNNNVQISNPITFVYNSKIDDNIDYNLEYELKYVIDIIKNASTTLKNDMKEIILSSITYDNSIAPNELISSIIYELSNNAITKNDLLNFIYKIKKYIGPFGESDNEILSNIKLNGNQLSFNSSLEQGNAIIYCNSNIYNEPIGPMSTIDVSKYTNNIVVIVMTNNDLKAKSNIIVINKSDKYMEVL